MEQQGIVTAILTLRQDDKGGVEVEVVAAAGAAAAAVVVVVVLVVGVDIVLAGVVVALVVFEQSSSVGIGVRRFQNSSRGAWLWQAMTIEREAISHEGLGRNETLLVRAEILNYF